MLLGSLSCPRPRPLFDNNTTRHGLFERYCRSVNRGHANLLNQNGHSLMKLVRVAVACALVLIPWGAPAARAAEARVNHAWVGHFVHVGGADDQRRVEEAIEQVVQEMSFLYRSLARSRLLDSNSIPKTIRISMIKSDAVVAFDERRYAAPVDGTSVAVVGLAGERLALQQRITREGLEMKLIGPQGGRTSLLRADGPKRLLLRVTVWSPRLPADVVYWLRFERAPRR